VKKYKNILNDLDLSDSFKGDNNDLFWQWDNYFKLLDNDPEATPLLEKVKDLFVDWGQRTISEGGGECEQEIINDIKKIQTWTELMTWLDDDWDMQKIVNFFKQCI